MQTNNKLRKALEKVLDAVKHLSRTHNDDLPEDVRAVLGGIAFDANAALAEPVKNCEVGTPEEQAARMDKFCDSHGHGFDGQRCYACENCKFISMDRCELAWAQMPYEEGGAK